MHRQFSKPITEQTILDDAIKAVRDLEAKRQYEKPFSNIEIYYTYYLAMNIDGNLAKAGIFLKAVKVCLDKGETFSPEFCEALPEVKDFNPSAKMKSARCAIS